jgi:hypothetical protein
MRRFLAALGLLLLAILQPAPAMAQGVKIRDLPLDVAPADSDEIPVAKSSNVTKKTTRGDLRANLCPTTRTITTTAPLAGGGALTSNLTLSVGGATTGSTGVVQLTADLAGTSTSPQVVDDSHNHTGTTISNLTAADLTAATAGRSLTISGSTLDTDAELYTRTACMTIESPVAADNFIFFRTPTALTATRIDCLVNAATSATVAVQKCDGNGAGCSNVHAAMACGTTNTAAAPPSSPAIGATAWLRVAVSAVSGSPGQVAVCMTYTVDD